MATRDVTLRNTHRAAIARTKPPCALCGDPIDYTLKYPDPFSFVADHIIPVDAGGPDILENKQAAHNKCNRKKWHSTEAMVIKRSGALR